MPATEVPHMELTAQNRCDRCGAQAYVVAQFGAGELLFCAHHARDHKDALAEHVTTDETATLKGA